MNEGLELLLLLWAVLTLGAVSGGSRGVRRLREKDCSPGTVPVTDGNATIACECGNVPSQIEEEKAGIAYCMWNTSTTGASTLSAVVRDTYWAGYVEDPEDDDNFIVTPCPFGFCNMSGGTLLPNPLDSDSVICGPRNRMGLLCAECKEGYAVALNRFAFDCINCSKEGVGSVAIWIFADIVPELVLVIVYLLIDAPLLKGQMNSFLLFAQTFYAMNLYGNGALDFSVLDRNQYSGLSDWVYWLYSLWSLNFLTTAPGFRPLCINSDMNALSQLSVQYVYAILPFSVILAAFFLQWCYRREPLRCGPVFRVMQSGHNCIARIQHSLGKSTSSIRNGLASFLLLAYSKLLFVSFYLLAYANLRQRDGSIKQRVFLDATRVPFKDGHQKYAVPAMCVIILFSALPALLLLCYTPILKLTARMKCCYKPQLRDALHESLDVDKDLQLTACGKFMQSLIMFLRTFNDCFQEKFAFFAGVLFLYRIIIWAIFANTSVLAVQYLCQIIITCLLLVLHVICKPYRRHLRWINVWDAVMYVNIIVINALSLYHNGRWHSNLTPNFDTFALQQILILLPLVYPMVVFVVYTAHVILRWRKKPNYTERFRRGSARSVPRSMYGSTDSHAESNVWEDGEEEPNAWLRETLVAQDSLQEGEEFSMHSLCYQLCPSVCRGASNSNKTVHQGRNARSTGWRAQEMANSLSLDVPPGQAEHTGAPQEEIRELSPQVITVSV